MADCYLTGILPIGEKAISQILMEIKQMLKDTKEKATFNLCYWKQNPLALSLSLVLKLD